MCAGIGESAIYEKIEDIEASLPPGTTLAYLPNLGNVKLRLTTTVNEDSAKAIANLSHLLNDDFADTVELIYKSKGRVIITGIGKSAIIANIMHFFAIFKRVHLSYIHPPKSNLYAQERTTGADLKGSKYSQ